jgi:hypothetical protein
MKLHGIKRARWKNAGAAAGAYAEIAGITDQSKIVYRLPGEDVKTPAGTQMFGGEYSDPEIVFTGTNSFNDLRARYVQTLNIDLELTLADDTTVTFNDVLGKVQRDELKGAIGGQRTYRLMTNAFSAA